MFGNLPIVANNASRTAPGPNSHLYRRRKIRPAICALVASSRESFLRKVPFHQLIPLVYHTTPYLLGEGLAIDSIAPTVYQIWEEDKYDLFSDWQAYCNSLEPDQRAVATFEGAIHFAAQSIVHPDERDAWTYRSVNLLQSLKSLDRVNDPHKTQTKRKRNTTQDNQIFDRDEHHEVIATISNQMIGASNMIAFDPTLPSMFQRTAWSKMTDIFFNVDMLGTILGSFLFTGMKASHARCLEKESVGTQVVSLYIPKSPGSDTKMDVWLDPSFGKPLLRANAISVEDLRVMLGEFLYNGMEQSFTRQEEKKKGISAWTRALEISCPGNGSEDVILELILSVQTTNVLYQQTVPPPKSI